MEGTGIFRMTTTVSTVESKRAIYGAYTLAQAAALARVSLRTVNRWFAADTALGPVIKRHMPENADNLISFIDLIQLLGVHTIRSRYEVSLQKLRQAVKNGEELGIAYPFATNATRAFLFRDQIVFQDQVGDYIEATGKHARAYLMEPVILPYLQDLTFDEIGLPYEYRPLEKILLAPRREWGAPIVEACGYTVQTLVNSVQAEGSIQGAAVACDVTEEEVRAALRYEDHLAGIAA